MMMGSIVDPRTLLRRGAYGKIVCLLKILLVEDLAGRV
ncbi:hypothetical protein STRTUCAR8_02628 [Streptomyces turgidiscabies Car8]|uniref:Uncharacterized protein n=1 Tax=Streptomyces turgidiscabies (strain Car8) TaxID=698760 RepID=L7EZI3_STRT8|nr:hypothetical protein STRTUCAR8_02628 [Streptomyces turgidiscabies Car8]